MKKGLIAIIIVGIIVVVCGSQLWSHHLKAKKTENRIEAQLTANKSNYDKMWKTFKEMSQVTELQAQQIKDVYTDIISGRYDDSNLLFKMVQESNPNMNTEVYTKLQNQVVAGRNEFDNNQKSISDMIREYNDLLVSYPIMTSLTGKERKDPNQFIVTSERTDGAFETKQDEEINILGK